MAPLIVITGPTASGKSGLAMELAERFSGEIICADSRTIYKGMDIGTAKPSVQDQQRVPHHLLDVVTPGEHYNVKQFQEAAFQKIAEIRARGNVPFLVGGTGLYVDAVTLEYQWPAVSDNDELTATYEGMTTEKLQQLIIQRGLVLPENRQNKRHLISTLQRSGDEGTRLSAPNASTYVVAITTDKDILRQRIEQRTNDMFTQGVVAETRRLAKQYGWENEAMTSNIYPIIRRVIDGEIPQAEAARLFAIKDWQLAKRQLTWLKRHDYVTWLSLSDAREHIVGILSDHEAPAHQ